MKFNKFRRNMGFKIFLSYRLRIPTKNVDSIDEHTVFGGSFPNLCGESFPAIRLYFSERIGKGSGKDRAVVNIFQRCFRFERNKAGTGKSGANVGKYSRNFFLESRFSANLARRKGEHCQVFTCCRLALRTLELAGRLP